MPALTQEEAGKIAQHWLEAFNDRRPDKVVEHFAEDVTAVSPAIMRLRPESGGVIHGRDELRSFYEDGIARIPDFEFTLVEVLTGIDQVTIVYRNQWDVLVAETLTFRPDGLVGQVNVTYGLRRDG